jgi:hypothetical protein
MVGARSPGARITPPSRKVSHLPTVRVVYKESRRRALPGHDDHDRARRLREERVEASEESTPPEASEESTPPEASEELTPGEARKILVGLALVLVAGVAALSGVGSVSSGLRADVLAALEKARDSSAAALDSSTEALRSVVSASVGKVGAVASNVGAVASNVGAVPSALAGDVVGALQQARDSSTAAVRSAVGEPPGKHFQSGSDQPFRKQYGSNVFLCLPNVHDVSVTRSVSPRSVPSLVSKGATYPVPASGCP